MDAVITDWVEQLDGDKAVCIVLCALCCGCRAVLIIEDDQTVTGRIGPGGKDLNPGLGTIGGRIGVVWAWLATLCMESRGGEQDGNGQNEQEDAPLQHGEGSMVEGGSPARSVRNDWNTHSNTDDKKVNGQGYRQW